MNGRSGGCDRYSVGGDDSYKESLGSMFERGGAAPVLGSDGNDASIRGRAGGAIERGSCLSLDLLLLLSERAVKALKIVKTTSHTLY